MNDEQNNSITLGANVVAEGATEPVATLEEPDTKITRDELKNLLKELIEEVKSEKLTEELVQKLSAELNTAKNDFSSAVQRVEDAISKVTKK